MSDCEDKINELEKRIEYALSEIDELYTLLEAKEDEEGRLTLDRLEKIEHDVAGIKKAIDYDAQNQKSRYLSRVYAILKKVERRVQ